MTEKEHERYKEFMYNEENIHNCVGCPENHLMDGWQHRLPCGQQNCWVECHCFPEKFSRN